MNIDETIALCIEMYSSTADKLLKDPFDRSLLKSIVLYGVKLINTIPIPKIVDREYAIKTRQISESVKIFIARLTPAELEDVFPLSKPESKNCYDSKNNLQSLPADIPIDKRLHEFLDYYSNDEIADFINNQNRILAVEQRLGIEGCSDMGLEFPYSSSDENGSSQLEHYNYSKKAKTKSNNYKKRNDQERTQNHLKLIKS